ncbi:hypothetical protein L4C36_14750 [Photobacterium japonica]|uniref:hypothetical protein n=1 Tax=Photobacterium japonica TaxID=2910235 RepID=UPI003D135CA2
MKKAIILLSALAILGCEDEDVKATIEGNTRVFAVDGLKLEIGNLTEYYSLEEAKDLIIIPNNLPEGDYAGLSNLGIKEEKQCGYIDASERTCFLSGDSSTCLPNTVKMLGVEIYTIDMENIDEAAQLGFYPTIASHLGGKYVDFDITTSHCPITGNEVN